MDIDSVHFWSQLLAILRAISNATFVAVDVEMSGIAMRGFGSHDRSTSMGKPNLQQHYEEVKQAAEKYGVLQFGLTCIEEDRQREMYVARPYNFNVTPLFIHGDRLEIKRDITLSTSAITFLIKNSFDIGAVFTKGVHYLSREDEALARLNYVKKQESSSAIPDVAISAMDPKELAFYERARQTILDFTNQKKHEMDYVNIEAPGGLNGLQRRLVYQLVRNEFPTCRTFPRSGRGFMQVEMLDTLKEAQVTRSKLQAFESSLARQIGLRFIFEALAGGDLDLLDPKWFSVNENGEPAFTNLEVTKKIIQELQIALKSKSRILVGHNLFVDLIFIYKTFVGALPDHVTDFNRRIHELFPQVFDTKFLATREGGSMQSKSSLKDLCDELKARPKPFVTLADGHAAYGAHGKEHEAGYDSWMTAQVFIKLSAKLAAEQVDSDGLAETLESRNDPNVSKSVRRALKKLRNHSEISSGNRTSKTIAERGLKQKIGTSFFDENMFNQLDVEGESDDGSITSLSSDSDQGGVPLSSNSLVPGASLMDSDIDDSFRVASRRKAFLRPAKLSSGSTGDAPEAIPGGLSRYWHAAQLNRHPLPKRPLEKAEKLKKAEAHWIPESKSSFWKNYDNRLRVYATETEICYLGN